MKLSKPLIISIKSFINCFYILQAQIIQELKSKGLYEKGYAMYNGERVLIRQIFVSHDCNVSINFEREEGYTDMDDLDFFTPVKS